MLVRVALDPIAGNTEHEAGIDPAWDASQLDITTVK